MINLLKNICRIIIPHFVTEWVVLEWNESKGGYVFAFPAFLLNEQDNPDYLIKVRSFSLFGFGLFPKLVSEKITYDEYLRVK